ncbi:penicillin-insensitive murein endopeptidase [Breoghania sp.]|uniref:penicillin-insensitive murein endopeptidase n=1 Tax=Breoghania sp. TaxID=2065378 RepID=UPI002AAC2BCB|nr:penicillin-insensitive murein endopeptidase [Breoghania sp.]
MGMGKGRAHLSSLMRSGAFALSAMVIALSPALARDQLPQPKPSVGAVSSQNAPAMPQAKATHADNARRATGIPSQVNMNAPARDYFGKVSVPAHMKPEALGSYAKGCQAGAVALPANGEGFQVMRLSRNRFWGQPELIDYLEDLARDVPKLGWRGLMVGDMAQPRGGPMSSGHASHQIGLDADIWLKEMPAHTMTASERENVSAVSMLRGAINTKGADRTVDPKKFTDAHARLIRRAANDPRVARIFVSPGIKKALCDFETGNRAWLRVVRPWWGHHYHFHVRLKCPAGEGSCKSQAAPPPGDGCGKELAWWMSDEPWVPKPPKPGEKPAKPKPPLTMAGLPDACVAVLKAR